VTLTAYTLVELNTHGEWLSFNSAKCRHEQENNNSAVTVSYYKWRKAT